jgi:soluble lytic murein transglycosylase-like protein
LTPKYLLLIAALAPAALSGCTSTGTNTSAAFNMAPGDPELPATMALEPGSTGEIVAVNGFAAAAPAGNAAAAVQSVVQSEVADAASPRQPEGEAAAAADDKSAPAAATTGPLAIAEAAAARKAGTMAAAGPPPAEGRAQAVKAIARPADLAAATAAPAAYAKADNPRGDLDQLIAKYAALYEVPVDLVRRVVKRESNFNPAAYNRGHYGLMQIKHATARGMGYQGSAKGLFDAETNLKYSVRYLRGAYVVADGDHNRADRLYQTGYYYHAKRKGLLEETGLGRDRVRRRAAALPEMAPVPVPTQ